MALSSQRFSSFRNGNLLKDQCIPGVVVARHRIENRFCSSGSGENNFCEKRDINNSVNLYIEYVKVGNNSHMFILMIDLKDICPKNWLSLDSKINDSQREVINRILSPQNSSSPLVVFGPFGTGKTFTLNQAVRQLVTRKSNHILLCTQTNSAADIHVELLHDYLTKQKGLKAGRPLRIYHAERR